MHVIPQCFNKRRCCLDRCFGRFSTTVDRRGLRISFLRCYCWRRWNNQGIVHDSVIRVSREKSCRPSIPMTDHDGWPLFPSTRGVIHNPLLIGVSRGSAGVSTFSPIFAIPLIRRGADRSSTIIVLCQLSRQSAKRQPGWFLGSSPLALSVFSSWTLL